MFYVPLGTEEPQPLVIGRTPANGWARRRLKALASPVLKQYGRAVALGRALVGAQRD